MVEISELEQKIDLINNFENKISEVDEYYALAIAEDDQSVIIECHENLKNIIRELEQSEFQMQFKGEADINNCYLEIHAGAGSLFSLP